MTPSANFSSLLTLVTLDGFTDMATLGEEACGRNQENC